MSRGVVPSQPQGARTRASPSSRAHLGEWGMFRAGSMDKGSGFGLEENTVLERGVCSDWLVTLILMPLFRSGSPWPEEEITLFHITRRQSGISEADVIMVFIHAFSIYPGPSSNTLPFRQSASAIPSGSQGALASPASAKPDKESLIPRIMDSAQHRSRET
ncbi:hypothetical protein V491_06737 [Pseudogymnoascus sp. VKM F-3775]|nr:hypothetical protein V491_06737 [Pseudogymnoascus sp. VKM F-3775]